MDPGKSDQELYLRYKKFKGLEKDPVVSPADQGLFYHNLLLLEASLVCGDAIGHVAQHPSTSRCWMNVRFARPTSPTLQLKWTGLRTI